MTYFGNSHIIQKNIVSSFEKADTNKSAFPGTKSKDIEGTGMRWVTVRGRKVLLRGDGGVVAGGKGMDSGKDINKLKPSSGAKKQSEKSPVSATNPDEPMGVEKNKWTKEQVEAYANGQDPNKVGKKEGEKDQKITIKSSTEDIINSAPKNIKEKLQIINQAIKDKTPITLKDGRQNSVLSPIGLKTFMKEKNISNDDIQNMMSYFKEIGFDARSKGEKFNYLHEAISDSLLADVSFDFRNKK